MFQLTRPLPSAPADHGGGRELSDLVFLRLVSLPKGRKLIARYLQLLPRGSDLSRTVVLAIMRHLRFLFGGAHADPGTATSLAGPLFHCLCPSVSCPGAFASVQNWM